MVVRKAVSTSDPTMAASLQKLAGLDLGAGFDSGLADAVLVGTGADNVVTDVQLYPEFNTSVDASSQKFSIRGYVSMLRSNDIGKNWPFSRKYLQICLENGRKPLLPPLEPVHSVRDLIDEEVKFEARGYGKDTERENLSSEDISGNFDNDTKHGHDNDFALHENEDGERKESDLINNGRITSEKPWQCLPVSLEGQASGTTCREDTKVTRNGNGCDVTINKAEEVEEFTGEDKQGQRARPIVCTGDEGDGEPKTAGKTEYKDSETETHRLSQPKDGQFRVKRANSEISFKQRRKRVPPSEISSDVKTGFPPCNKQVNKMLTTSETKSQEEINRGQKEVRKREHSVEQGKAEPGRTEDFTNSGSVIPDGGMLINVCPVCRTFSSTSNTALNAHMDHCLAVEPNKEKTVSSKFTKHKMKARKKRSMADICAVAPTRTLEDLEHSTAEQLALDDANPLELDSFKWNDSDIRRQPRTSLYRAAKKYISYIDPKESNRENSQNMKMECQPLLQKEKQNECPPLLQKEKQKECPPFEVKLDQPHGMRKNKRSSLGDFTGASQSSHSHTLIKVKVPKASPANRLNECIPQHKSRIQSHETAMEEKLPSSVNASAWTCLNKQGSLRTKKFKQKLVRLSLAGFGKRHCNEQHGVPMDMLELKDKSHLEGLTLSQGPVVESESPRRSISHLSDKEHDSPFIIPSKRNRAKQTTKVQGINCTPSVEVEEFYTSKRMKNLSSLNFQKMAACTDTRGQSSVSLRKSPTSEKGQGEQEVSFLYQSSIEKVRQDPSDSDQLSVDKTLISQKSGSVAASKLLENKAGSSLENLRHNLSMQMDISCADSENGAAATLKPFNKNPGSDSTDHITDKTNICSTASKSFESHSTVHHFKTPEAPTISNEINALNTDGIRVTLISNDTYSADKPIISSEMRAENEGVSMPSLRNLNEGSLSMPQSSGFLQRPIFDHSIQTSSCATSVGLPLTSQGSLFQERAMLLEDPQPVGNGHYSLGTRMSLDSVEKPQVIAPSLLSVNSGEINTAGEVIHGLSNWALPYTNANSGIRGKRQVNIKKQNLRLSPLLQERPYAAV